MYCADFKKHRPVDEICAELRNKIRADGIKQADIAQKCEINQGQVSRLLDGKCGTVTKGLKKICNYVSVDIYEALEYDPLENKDLMNAIRMAVGNSPNRAKTLERIVQAFAEG